MGFFLLLHMTKNENEWQRHVSITWRAHPVLVYSVQSDVVCSVDRLAGPRQSTQRGQASTDPGIRISFTMDTILHASAIAAPGMFLREALLLGFC